MRIDFTAPLDKNNKGIDELLKLLAKKGIVSLDLKKGCVSLYDFPAPILDSVLSIIRENFDITSLDLNKEPKFKIRNDEKELQLKKSRLKAAIEENPTSIVSKVREYILKEKVFTLTQLREVFPKINFATLRSYVNAMKNDNILVELERGKYAVR